MFQNRSHFTVILLLKAQDVNQNFDRIGYNSVLIRRSKAILLQRINAIYYLICCLRGVAEKPLIFIFLVKVVDYNCTINWVCANNYGSVVVLAVFAAKITIMRI